MQPLSALVEPSRLLMTWQPSDESAGSRTRRVIGEVLPGVQPSFATFRYLRGTEDYQLAVGSGFKGFPAFRMEDAETHEGVLESLMRRLPPRNREDFQDYLRLHGLSAPFVLSDFALLGYTGARLPSDGFGLVPEFPLDACPCEYVMEVAGTRHVLQGTLADVRIGEGVSFSIDEENPVESDAIAVNWHGERIGYVNRALKPMFHRWMASGRTLSAVIERLNGKPGRPLVYVRVRLD
jgi:hypothetical protein